jgi:hypothetical protein
VAGPGADRDAALAFVKNETGPVPPAHWSSKPHSRIDLEREFDDAEAAQRSLIA